MNLWPDGLRPGLPGQQLPGNRDSTQYLTLTIPGSQSGHELFQSVDIAGNFLYVAYNAGLQVWNIGPGNQENPQRLEFRDGWVGHFFDFPDPDELDTFVEHIAAIDPSSGANLVALSGLFPVGISLWDHNTSQTPGLSQLYQDNFSGVDVRQVRLVEFNGTVWAFAATKDGTIVYNASQARTVAPCEDSVANSDRSCPGVFRGFVGSMTDGGFADVIERDGRIYVAASDGRGLPSAPLSVEIWELGNPSNPAGAIRRFAGSGISSDSRAVTFFRLGSDYYLAFIESRTTLKIFNVNNCLDLNGCSSLGSPTWSTPIATSTTQLLTFSMSNSTPFLYYGVDEPFFGGSARERLYDLSTLGGSNQITEITTGGGTYADTCTGQQVGYWADYYPSNEFGLRNFTPREGKFNGTYFYRAARGILDVHVRDDVGGGDPTITTNVSTAPPWWMGYPVNFTATVTPPGSCNGGSWSWFSDDSFSPSISGTGSTANVTFNLCGQSTCPQRTPTVWATNSACPQAIIVEEDGLTLRDPRPNLQSLAVTPAGGSYDVGTPLTFIATADGRDPLTYTWEVFEQGGSTPLVSVSGVGLSSFDQWNTCISIGPPLDLIFSDGFESGNLSLWSGTSDDEPPKVDDKASIAPQGRVVDLAALVAAKGGSASFDIEVMVSNSDGSAMSSVPVTLSSIGPVAFQATPITIQNQGAGQYQMTANTNNATEWRWVVEDPANGSTTNCAPAAFSRCEVFDWSGMSQITYRWLPPNASNTNYGVLVEARNCEGGLDASDSVFVTGITAPDPPTIGPIFQVHDSSFGAAGSGKPCIVTGPGELTCERNRDITFSIDYGGGTTQLIFDWDANGSFDQTVTASPTVIHRYTQNDPAMQSQKPSVKGSNGSQETNPLSLLQRITLN